MVDRQPHSNRTPLQREGHTQCIWSCWRKTVGSCIPQRKYCLQQWNLTKFRDSDWDIPDLNEGAVTKQKIHGFVELSLSWSGQWWPYSPKQVKCRSAEILWRTTHASLLGLGILTWGTCAAEWNSSPLCREVQSWALETKYRPGKKKAECGTVKS